MSRHDIEQNPVKGELAVRPEDWEASSAARTDMVTNPCHGSLREKHKGSRGTKAPPHWANGRYFFATRFSRMFLP